MAPSRVIGGSSNTPQQDVDSMRTRIAQLEAQLYKPPARELSFSSPTPASQIETITTKLGGTFHQIHHGGRPGRLGSDVLGSAPAISRSISNKTRLFGQSHWANTVALGVRYFYV